MNQPFSIPRKIYHNPVQIKVGVINAKITVIIGGRALGKTSGIHAPRTAKCMTKMPKSSNAFVSRTYRQFKSRIMGSLLSGWRDLGFREWTEAEGGHFTIGKKNPKFPTPKFDIGDYSNCVHWFTGAIMVLISQDRPGDGNGTNIQSLAGDEAYQLDKRGLDEDIIPAMRGFSEYSKLTEYKMITLTTSMPLTPDGAWLFDYEKQTDPLLNKYIMEVYGQWYKTYFKLANPQKEYSEIYIQQLQSELKILEEILNEQRDDYTYYLEADSFENYHVLGEKYFKTQRRILDNNVFDSQILNLRPEGIDKGKRFYGMLSTTHFYYDYNNPYYDKFDIILPDSNGNFTEDLDSNCLGDLDCDRNNPLEISLDYGGRINSMVICQEKKDSFNVIKELFAEQSEGEWLDHLIEKFNSYYDPMTCRTIYFYDDVNGNKSQANTNETLRQTAVRLLTEGGWIVHIMSDKTNPFHQDKWEFINLALFEKDKRLPLIRINEGNCPDLKIAMFNAPLKIGEKGKKQKNKNSESFGSKTPQRQATHITDAFDYIYFNKFRDNVEEVLSGWAPILGN
jgi:hypothetical protein